MSWNGIRRVVLIATLVGLEVACGSTRHSMHDKAASMNHFRSPEAAVPLITEMLRQEDFVALATYYDLSGSEVPREELETGAFFIRKERPEFAHPGGFWRYRHPFAPGFEYFGRHAAGKPGVHVVTVEISIDQGEGAPPQVGRASFYMIESSEGWRILPGRVVEEEEGDVPHVPEVE